jgi:hypothetical protein
MEINFSKNLRDLDGEDLIEKGQPINLKTVCVNALLAQFRDETDIDGIEKVKRYKLSTKIYDSNGNIDLSSEEISLIKKLVGKAFSTIIVGQAFDMLN